MWIIPHLHSFLLIKWKCHSSQKVSQSLKCIGKALLFPRSLCCLSRLQCSVSLPVPLEVLPHLTHCGVSPAPAQSAFSGAVQLSPGSELALRSMALEKASLTQASPLRKQPLVVARLSGTCFSSSLVSNTIPIFCSCRNGRLCYV